MLFTYSRPILGPSFGPNGWNGTRTNNVFLLALAAPCVGPWSREDYSVSITLWGWNSYFEAFWRGGEWKIVVPARVVGQQRKFWRVAGDFANAGRKPAENCVLPQMKEQTGRRW